VWSNRCNLYVRAKKAQYRQAYGGQIRWWHRILIWWYRG
jgi:hypothetical protein